MKLTVVTLSLAVVDIQSGIYRWMLWNCLRYDGI